MSQHKLDQARRVRFIPLDRKGNPLPAREQTRIEREQEEGDRQRAEARALERQQSELIEQFERQQLKTKDWISFAEIIDWRSRQETNGVPCADNEKVALDDLWREVSAGVIFYTEGRSHILLTSLDYGLTDVLVTDLSALPDTAWVARERWLAWREIHTDRTIDRLLRSCWVPRDLCLKFAASVPFQPKPDWTGDHQAQNGHVGAAARKAGAKARYPWGVAEAFVHERMDHHGDFDLSDPDWKCQADAEDELAKWFADQDLHPVESVVRARVSQMIERWRERKQTEGR